jgi:biopolymer transport protein ExbD/biopolymer transport protein TolR
MKYLLEVCLIALTLAGTTPWAAAQSAAEVPMQRGISVELPVTKNAVAAPDADKEDALVVTVTHDGSVYLGINSISTDALGTKLKNALFNRTEKTLYIKADARVPYASLMKVLDSVRTTGVERLTLLTAQRDLQIQRTLVPPKGLEMQVVQPRQGAGRPEPK